MSGDDERPVLVLPCKHFADRPTSPKSTIICEGCGQTWEMTYTGVEWLAKRVRN